MRAPTGLTAIERSPSGTKSNVHDAARVIAPGPDWRRTLPEAADIGPLYRWGWLPLVAGCAAITIVAIIASEAAFAALGITELDATRRVVFIARSVITSSLLATWAGWYVLRTRHRIEAAREALLLKRKELEARVTRAEQLAGIGAFSRTLAHEIRSPLNTIAIHCAVLERRARELDKAGEPLHGTIQVLLGETARLKHLVDEYIAFGRAGQVEVHLSTTNLEAIARSVAEVARASFRQKGLSIEVEAPADLPLVCADAENMAYVVHLLLRMACEASPQGGTIRMRLRGAGAFVSLAVHGDGPPFADPGALFRPFFIGQEPAAGFGLAIVKDIVRAHAGEIHAGNDGHGEPFTVIRIPRADP